MSLVDEPHAVGPSEGLSVMALLPFDEKVAWEEFFFPPTDVGPRDIRRTTYCAG